MSERDWERNREERHRQMARDASAVLAGLNLPRADRWWESGPSADELDPDIDAAEQAAVDRADGLFDDVAHRDGWDDGDGAG